MSIIKIINVETGEEIEREMTPDELADLRASQSKAQAKVEAETQLAVAKAALFERLGITEEEAKLLLS